MFWLARVTIGQPEGDLVEWREQFRTGSQVPFDVVGKHGGRVRLDLGFARFDSRLRPISGDHPHVNDDNREFDTLLRANGVSPTAFMGIRGDTRFYETTFVEGSPITVYGRAESSEVVRSDGYRDAPERALCMRGTELEPLVFLGV